MSDLILAAELSVSDWFNTPQPLSIAGLRGKVIFLHSFQLLCPGCVAESLPQVRRIERIFANTDIQVIGLHTVFEHHEAMTPTVLKAFIHEYRLTSPIGVDQADQRSDIPVTMRRYGFRGTPSSVLQHPFGRRHQMKMQRAVWQVSVPRQQVPPDRLRSEAKLPLTIMRFRRIYGA